MRSRRRCDSYTVQSAHTQPKMKKKCLKNSKFQPKTPLIEKMPKTRFWVNSGHHQTAGFLAPGQTILTILDAVARRKRRDAMQNKRGYHHIILLPCINFRSSKDLHTCLKKHIIRRQMPSSTSRPFTNPINVDDSDDDLVSNGSNNDDNISKPDKLRCNVIRSDHALFCLIMQDQVPY